MTKKLQVLTNSELETFRSCRALHGYTYHELLRALTSGAPATRGTFGHAGIAAGWRAAFDEKYSQLEIAERLQLSIGSALGAVDALQAEAFNAAVAACSENLEEQTASIAESADEARSGVRMYFAKRESDFSTRIPLAIEQPFSVRMRTPKGGLSSVVFGGVIDAVFLDVDAWTIRIEDHKFTEINPSGFEKRLALNTQTTGYLDAVRTLLKSPMDPFWTYGREVYSRLRGQLPLSFEEMLATAQTGLLAFNVIKAKVPGVPSINKDGHVSVKQIDTTPEIYADALAAQVFERNLAIEPKQSELLATIRAKSGSWVSQFEFTRNDTEIERWRAELLTEAAQIRATGRDPSLRTRNPGHCTKQSSYACSMRGVCLDPTSETIRRTSYRIATCPHEEIEGALQHGSNKENLGW